MSALRLDERAERSGGGNPAAPGRTRPVRAGRRTRPLPTGRAVVGGLLVTAAALGAWTVQERASRPPTTRYLVATAPVAPGGALEAAVTLRAMLLPPEVAAAALTDLSAVEGRRARTPLVPGQVLTAASLTEPGGGADGLDLTLAVPGSRALGGRLRPGDRVDVVATVDGCTTVVAPAAEVRAAAAERAEFGDRTVTVNLALPDRASVLAVVHAADAGELTLARPAPGLDAPVPPARCTAGAAGGPASGA